jgi:hypothetical protein
MHVSFQLFEPCDVYENIGTGHWPTVAGTAHTRALLTRSAESCQSAKLLSPVALAKQVIDPHFVDLAK